ncbi:MAG: hypothetical protein KC492_41170, partial [Myxococcales bacterium]|nr:hypothetical protein [Myxococcales bacterium]
PRRSLSLIVLLAAAGMTGCVSTKRNADADRVRSDLTPELYTLYQTPDDVKNVIAVMKNENERMRRQDMGRVFYTDRPSRLTREPVPW